jgi:hypothetical protein
VTKKWNGKVERYPPFRSTFLAGTIFGTTLERHFCNTMKTIDKSWNGVLERSPKRAILVLSIGAWNDFCFST